MTIIDNVLNIPTSIGLNGGTILSLETGLITLIALAPRGIPCCLEYM